ncbi:hypothetical protein DPEC_G00146540 [Dallia pectoralis]|uniref:Uncharacterized protein n=1 Tax=Dallia pectoralis TaxID=75939 RepID=A0ACC2GPD6_DALPE|nr:hypothetical protein DPEC_G00146540 [Dallia pectoralis]
MNGKMVSTSSEDVKRRCEFHHLIEELKFDHGRFQHLFQGVCGTVLGAPDASTTPDEAQGQL